MDYSNETINPYKFEGHVENEQRVLKYWKDENIYNKLQTKLENSKNEFNFMDGPPFVSGNLHVGHVAVGSIKDAVLRFNMMHGKKCNNKLGYDCHGLPSECRAMKHLNLNTCEDIEKYGIDKFNKECKRYIDECMGSWESIYDSIGRWVDLTNTYKTVDTNFMETTWWIFSQLNQKNLIYKSYKVMPYSTSCETPLSNFEAGLNYQTIKTQSIYVLFKLKQYENTYIVAWTTTPWTLFSNVALCVNPNMKYVICEDDKGIKYVVAETSIKNLKINIKSQHDFMMGLNMVGFEYEPLFNYIDFTYHKILADEYVKDSTTIGTGVVHIAPSHGVDDSRICIENNVISSRDLNKICNVDSTGKYKKHLGKYSNMYVLDADKEIIKELKERQMIIRTQEYSHEYPFCWRSNTPLLYLSVSSFFVEVSKIKDRMIELNDKIKWSKKEIGENRFKKWLYQAKDWGISRNRYFGTPIPVWESEDGSESITIGSIEELVKKAKLNYIPNDLHLDSISDIVIISETTGNVLKLNGDVMDCWFESGSVPFGQIHYPFENSNYFNDKEYLSDFVAEGLDQTRGWFYTLLAISTAIIDKPPFKNVICTGMILDENGKKISKKDGNFIDISVLLKEYGADTLRLLCLKSPLVNAEPLLFKQTDIKELFQKLQPYINSVRFFIDHYINSQTKENPITINYINSITDIEKYTLMDLWILEKTYMLRHNIEKYMEEYKIDYVIKMLINYIDDLTNWYIKFNRDRLKGFIDSESYQISLSTLYTVLIDFTTISSPFIPFLTEHIYQCLKPLLINKHKSIHLNEYPNVIHSYGMTEPFERSQKLTRLIRHIRDMSINHNSSRIPIKKCSIYHHNQTYLNDIKKLIQLIEEEINCLTFEYISIDNDSICPIVYSIKPNFKTIGETYKKDSQLIAKELLKISQNDLKELYNKSISCITININNKDVHLNYNYFDINIKIINDNSNIKSIEGEGLIVCCDVLYDEEIHNIFQIKNLISFIQNFRKELGLNFWNKIEISYKILSECKSFDEVYDRYKNEVNKKIGYYLERNIEYAYKKIFKFKKYNDESEIDIEISIKM